MIDVSDGLSSELHHICKQSNLGCIIFEEKIPIDPITYQTARDLNLDPTVCALNGGEDYELLFTIPLNEYDKIKGNPNFSVIGHTTDKNSGLKIYNSVFRNCSKGIFKIDEQTCLSTNVPFAFSNFIYYNEKLGDLFSLGSKCVKQPLDIKTIIVHNADPLEDALCEKGGVNDKYGLKLELDDNSPIYNSNDNFFIKGTYKTLGAVKRGQEWYSWIYNIK
jgi:hypothetical protein